MLTLTPITTADAQYAFVEDLLHVSFPACERRDDREQRAHTDHTEAFTAYLATEGDDAVGLLTCWEFKLPEGGEMVPFERFTYVEHLAVMPSRRNSGYGAKILDLLKAKTAHPIILEVEPPQEEMSRRRIGFYKRSGFKLCLKDYLQPPYRPGDAPFPLLLMFYGTESLDPVFEPVRDTIHRFVYGAYGADFSSARQPALGKV